MILQYRLDIFSSFRDNRIIHLPPALAYHPSLEVTPTKQLFIFNIFLKICGQRFPPEIKLSWLKWKIQNQVLLLENNLLSELPSFLGSLPKLKILTIRCNFSILSPHFNFSFSPTHQMYVAVAYWSMLSSQMKCVKVQFCRIISFCLQAEHDQLPTKGCSGRWMQVWLFVFFGQDWQYYQVFWWCTIF